MNIMLSAIAHYPESLRKPIGAILENPAKHMRHVFEGPRINFPSDTITLKGKDLPLEGATWVSAALAPCFFIALVSRNDRGDLQEVNAGHFSAHFDDREFSSFLAQIEAPPERNRFFIAGMAQRTSHFTLKRSAERILGGINTFGLPVSLGWENEARPYLTDLRSGRRVSDLGLGLSDGAEEDKALGRYVSLGVTSTHVALVSTVFRRTPGVLTPYQTHLITEETGVITKEHLLES